MNMNRFFAAGLVALFGLSAACGGGGDGGDGGATEEVATEEAVVEGEETASLTTPDWMTIDEASQTVTLDIVAGKDDSNNRWNFNGYSRGNGAIVVPLGYTVTINFRNDDPNIAHSIGVDTRTGDFPATFQDPEPVFAGAISAAATSMQEGTQPGESESFSFTADAAGEYSLICYIPAHAATGMWIRFTVSSDGEVGFFSY
jgi:FtsP/CotA-like multicopper oxidase with cupredoxin domain